MVNYYWWCPTCKEEKTPQKVSYGENCCDCGDRVNAIPIIARWYPGEVETPATDPDDSYGNGWIAGADAIIDALRQRGVHVDHDTAFSSVGERRTLRNTGVTGTWVFIPDDNDKEVK